MSSLTSPGAEPLCHPVRLDFIPAGQTSFPRVRRHSRGSDVIPEGQTSFPRKRESCDGGVFQDPDTSDRRLRGDDQILELTRIAE